MPPPDDHTNLWEYTFESTFQPLIFHRIQEAQVQYIDLSQPEDIYVILQAKPDKKASTHPSVTWPTDLISEMVACID